MNGYGIGDFVIVTLADGTVMQGEIVRIGKDNVVIDEYVVFGDWVFIEFCNILDIRKAALQNCQ